MTVFYENVVYCTYLEDFQYQEDIVSLIDAFPDVQKHRTNVKAKMTDWNMLNYLPFDELGKEILNFCKTVSKNRYNIFPDLYIHDIWGMCYQSNDYAIAHDHWPATWSCAYYPKVPENSSSLIFPELNIEVQPQTDMLVVFPGWVSHRVDTKDFVGNRYVVSANVYAK